MNARQAMNARQDRDFDPPFHVVEPDAGCGPVVICSPHSGRLYPPRFLAMTRLDPHMLRRSEDAYVDLLAAGASRQGAPLIHAVFPRAFLDVNREPYELDPRMFETRLPGYVNARSARVAAGLGTVPRVVADGHEIYAVRLPAREALDRIEQLHKPFHAALRGLTDRARRQHDVAVLLDLHSMPSASAGPVAQGAADIILGDRFGSSCGGWLIDAVEARLTALRFRVVRNRPYAGGFITECYGAPGAGLHTLQIEIARSLYMDERRLALHEGFARIAAALAEIVEVATREALRAVDALPRMAAE